MKGVNSVDNTTAPRTAKKITASENSDSSNFPFLKKFHTSKKTVVWSVVSTLLSLIIYVVILIFIESFLAVDRPVPYGFYVLRDISLVVFTILITSIITAFLVETRSKNELYHNTILDDVIANPVFYQSFSDETKQEILRNLEQQMLFLNNSKVQNMYESIQMKLLEATKEGYYFSECSYHVSCKIDDTSILKKINRTIRLRSYENTHTIHNLPVLKWSGLHTIEHHFSLDGISINGRSASKDSYRLKSTQDSTYIDSFCGYSITYECVLIKPIELQANTDTIISISYTTRVPLSDNVYTCRSSVPCRRFLVDAHLEDSPNYKINALAFGFLDVATRSPVPLSDNEIRVDFDDWVFNKDGVVISFAPRLT